MPTKCGSKKPKKCTTARQPSPCRVASSPSTPTTLKSASSRCIKSVPGVADDCRTKASIACSVSAGTQTEISPVVDSQSQTEPPEPSQPDTANAYCQTERLAPTNVQTQTEARATADGCTQMAAPECVDSEAQVDLIIGGPELYLKTLLEMAAESMFTIQLASRKVQVLLQGGRVVVRTGGGFLKLEEFLAKYGQNTGITIDSVKAAGISGGVGTVVRKSNSGVSLTSFR
mmetsp:Transcript_35852/g.67594  ORF Transcript_35852/g.67594 Transcript_35852/m.67594 type:complete len:230 (+) Transcript_35852:66-755(+)